MGILLNLDLYYTLIFSDCQLFYETYFSLIDYGNYCFAHKILRQLHRYIEKYPDKHNLSGIFLFYFDLSA